MAGTYEDLIKMGAIVEVSSNDQGLRGSWYSATVLRPCSRQNAKIYVEYHRLMTTKSGNKPLREHVDAILVRPAPPREPPCSVVFKVDDDIDAFHNDGWWEGVVIQVLEGARYSLFFRCSREQIEFHASQLRVHREWFNGDWLPPLDPTSPLPTLSSCLKTENGVAIGTRSSNRLIRCKDYVAPVIERPLLIEQAPPATRGKQAKDEGTSKAAQDPHLLRSKCDITLLEKVESLDKNLQKLTKEVVGLHDMLYERLSTLNQTMIDSLHIVLSKGRRTTTTKGAS